MARIRTHDPTSVVDSPYEHDQRLDSVNVIIIWVYIPLSVRIFRSARIYLGLLQFVERTALHDEANFPEWQFLSGEVAAGILKPWLTYSYENNFSPKI